jgi:hypothetical protein
MIEILRTVKGFAGSGSVVLEWVDGRLDVWLSTRDGEETPGVRLDRLGVYELYASLAVINAAADAYEQRPAAVSLDAT